MSRRPATTSKRLERRAERDARKPGNVPAPRRNRASRTPTRSAAKAPRNLLPFFAGFAALLILGLLGYAVYSAQQVSPDELPDWRKAELNDDARLPGAYTAPHPGEDGVAGTSDDRKHFANGLVVPICTESQIEAKQISTPPCYLSNPPTSGPHAASPMGFGVLENPAPKENLIHTMEHGGVVIWYNTDNAGIIGDLEAITKDAVDRRRLVTLTRYPGMEPDTVALTGWTRLDKFPVNQYTKKRVTDFIEEHNKRFNPEGF